MSGPPNPERLNQQGFAAFAARARESSPVIMLNLLRFLPQGGRERYLEYRAAIAPLLEKAGARIVLLGESSPPLLGEEGWDTVLLVEYPSRAAFLEMLGSDEYQALAHLRTEALSVGELHPLELDGDPPPA